MDKLIFVKSERRKSSEATHIRIDKRQYELIKELSAETGLSVYDTANKLLQFAIDNVEIAEA